MQTDQDRQLLERIEQDPQRGLAELLACYGSLLHAQVRRLLPDPRDAEECLADVLVRCWQQAGALRSGDHSLKAWLLVTARNRAIDYYRRLRRSAADPLPEDFELMARELVEPRQSEAEDVIAELVDAMPQPDREIFQRRYYGLQTSREIGLALQMEEHAVNVRLSRGRAKLKQAFLRRWNKEDPYAENL